MIHSNKENAVEMMLCQFRTLLLRDLADSIFFLLMLIFTIMESDQFPGGGHGKPLHHSCHENPHGQRNLAGCKESDMTEQLSTAYRYQLWKGRHFVNV